MKIISLRHIALITLLFAFAAKASDDQCRLHIVEAHKSVGESIAEDAFSNSTFEELNISMEDYNIMSSEEQEAIYMKVKPLAVMIEETISLLNRYIKRYVGTNYELFLTDEIETWRSLRDNLRECLK